MKVLCSGHIDVAAPAQNVFDFIAAVSKWPLWFSGVVSAQQSDTRELAPNQEVHVCFQTGRRRWHETFEVSRCVRNAFLSLEGELSAARRIDFRLEQRAAHARVLCAIGYRVFGGPAERAYDSLFGRPRVSRELRRSLVNLRGLLEEALSDSVLPESAASDAQPPSSVAAATPGADTTPTALSRRGVAEEVAPVA
ncbi:MAG: SRPBCC family protein [Candidatus Eremiobacteraeota bacterium]|nr:SRPBCC family protein [Candidatus Eremiobacteraeota bacterium]